MNQNREIYLFRHGYSRANAHRYKRLPFQKILLFIRHRFGFHITVLIIKLIELFKTGKLLKRVADKDIPLEQVGLTQAKLTGNFLARKKILPDLILSSDYLRTRETTSGILDGIKEVTGIDYTDKILYTNLIIERDGGVEYGYPLSFYPVLFPATNEVYQKTHKLDFKPPGGESIREVRSNRIPKLIPILNSIHAKKIFIVGHGITNSTILSLLTETSIDQVKIGMENLGVYHFIEEVSGKWKLDPLYANGERIDPSIPRTD